MSDIGNRSPVNDHVSRPSLPGGWRYRISSEYCRTELRRGVDLVVGHRSGADTTFKIRGRFSVRSPSRHDMACPPPPDPSGQGRAADLQSGLTNRMLGATGHQSSCGEAGRSGTVAGKNFAAAEISRLPPRRNCNNATGTVGTATDCRCFPSVSNSSTASRFPSNS
jgi:hypothetical protein